MDDLDEEIRDVILLYTTSEGCEGCEKSLDLLLNTNGDSLFLHSFNL